MQPKYLRTPYRIFWVGLGFMIICRSGLLSTMYNCQVLDDQNFRRRFRVSNYRTTTRVNPFVCTMPIRLEVGWNQIQFNLSDLTRRAYGTRYIETLRVQVNNFRCKNVLAKCFWKFHIFDICPPPPFRFMRTAEYGGCISQTDYTQRMSFLQSSNSTCLYRTRRTRSDTHRLLIYLLMHNIYYAPHTILCVCVFWFLEAVEIFDRHCPPSPDTSFLLNMADLAELCQIRRTECKWVEINQYIFDAFKLLLKRSLYLIVYFSNCLIICPPLWWTFVWL